MRRLLRLVPTPFMTVRIYLFFLFSTLCTYGPGLGVRGVTAAHMNSYIQFDVICLQVAGKSKIINMAISDIGFGRYQYAMFVLCGFGWFADNFWLQVRTAKDRNSQINATDLSCRVLL